MTVWKISPPWKNLLQFFYPRLQHLLFIDKDLIPLKTQMTKRLICYLHGVDFFDGLPTDFERLDKNKRNCLIPETTQLITRQRPTKYKSTKNIIQFPNFISNIKSLYSQVSSFPSNLKFVHRGLVKDCQFIRRHNSWRSLILERSSYDTT